MRPTTNNGQPQDRGRDETGPRTDPVSLAGERKRDPPRRRGCPRPQVLQSATTEGCPRRMIPAHDLPHLEPLRLPETSPVPVPVPALVRRTLLALVS